MLLKDFVQGIKIAETLAEIKYSLEKSERISAMEQELDSLVKIRHRFWKIYQ